MNVFKLHWRFGKEEHVTGNTVTDACNNTGIGSGALAALDYWEQVEELPDHLKRFEIITENDDDPDVIHNPYFIEQLKQTGFEKGSITEIKFANRKFAYEFVGTSSTGYQYLKC